MKSTSYQVLQKKKKKKISRSEDIVIETKMNVKGKN